MSLTIVAYTVVGVKIDLDHLYNEPQEVVDEIHNDCKVVGEGKFCSSCGKPVWTTVREPIDGFDEEGGGEYQGSLGGLTLLRHEWRGSKEICGQAFLCSWIGEVASWSSETGYAMAPGNLERHEKAIKEVLEPLGLWNRLDFGVYTLLSVS
jgi:hypothetical protein